MDLVGKHPRLQQELLGSVSYGAVGLEHMYRLAADLELAGDAVTATTPRQAWRRPSYFAASAQACVRKSFCFL